MKLKNNKLNNKCDSLFRQFCVHADKRQMLQTLMNSLASQPQPGRILWELACCISSAVGADGFILHLVHPFTGQIRVFRRCSKK